MKFGMKKRGGYPSGSEHGRCGHSADSGMTADEPPKGSMLHRADPLSKLIGLLGIAALAIHGSRPELQAGLLAFVLLISAIGAGISLSEAARRMALVAGFGIPLFVLTLLAAPEGSVYAAIGPFQVTSGGVASALVVVLRLGSLYLSSHIYIATTNPRDFVYMLTRWFRVPYRLAFGVSVALTFLPLLESEGRVAAAARRIRSGRPPQGLMERMVLLRNLAASVFTASIRRVQQTAGAMDVKGFGAYAHRSFLHEVRISRWGMGAAFCVLAAAVLLWPL
ncbi:energy-coupling factor transporter transmembrane component T family protein [Paenibacillus caui]|uniref:energy-coupling factor transporter transmembrane component T family protein n=1 Tax=Paenibacillus caui TaxID=2873927 RepID=UPI001CA86FA7|nr:energy-coupling factor transporter transmembrane component T [Paenibacillus caui]